MRPLLLVLLLLLAVPGVVAVVQWRAAQDAPGTPADYLTIETPEEIDADHPLLAREGVPVLCYHYLRAGSSPGHLLRVVGAVLLNLPTLDDREYWTNTASEFERQMQWLVDNGYRSLTLDELHAHLAEGRPVPEKSVAITFDDGDRTVYDVALPILQRTGLRASLFVVTGQVGREWRNVDMLGWDELAELQASGHFEVHSHTHDMHYKVKVGPMAMEPVFRHLVPATGPLDRASADRVRLDLERSRRALQRHLGHDSRHLAWPYGFANARLDSLAREAGYTTTYSLLAGQNVVEDDSPWQVRRFTMTARSTLRIFRSMVEGDHERGVRSGEVLEAAAGR